MHQTRRRTARVARKDSSRPVRPEVVRAAMSKRETNKQIKCGGVPCYHSLLAVTATVTIVTIAVTVL